MASQSTRPTRTLLVFSAALILAFLLIALNNAWKPELGLDLRGGARITLTAQGAHLPNGKTAPVTADSLAEARNIIDSRVNGSGVAAAQVTTEGGELIIVSIPGAGATQQALAEKVSRTAQLRFRYVACEVTQGGFAPQGVSLPALCTQSAASPSTSTFPPRAPFAERSTSPSATPKASASSKPSSKPSSTATVAPAPVTDPQNHDISVDQAYTDMTAPNPPKDVLAAYSSTICPVSADGSPTGKSIGTDLPGNWLVSCGNDGLKYLLTPALIEGTDIDSASAQLPTGQANWSVSLNFKSSGSSKFADATGKIAGNKNQHFAVVVDGIVQSAPTASSRISGTAEITGGFTQDEAKDLANNLNYGSLPLDFPKDKQSTLYIGPSLAGQQLTTGLWAGAIGLLLVMVFALLYYRGLGLVVIGSLFAAGAATYALVALLSKSAGVTLDLPGIAGLIVAVGITADSFIVYFERIRDEMRDGKSMRVAVDAAWIRARRTCLAADSVSLLAAMTLYIFASNDVKGFAFMLGLSTLIDLVVFFYFTHPLVKLLSLRRFFNRGHKFSGLDARTLGVDAITVGGKA